MPTAPNLGYGNTQEADLNTVNQWLRSQPEYQAKLASWGMDQNNVHLNDAQKQEIVRLAQSLGVVVDEGHNGQEVDDSGNFRGKGHKLRNTLIVAGVAAAALATMGAAGVFAGGAGAAGAGGAGAAGAAGVLPSTAIGAGFIPALGLESSLAGGAAAAGAGAVAAGAGAGAFDAAGNFIGDTTISSLGGPAAGVAGTVGAHLSTADKIANILGAVGKGVGDAATAAGQNRQDQQRAGLTANGQNIAGQSAFETELMNRAHEEDIQRGVAKKDAYRASVVANPHVSPFDTTGGPKYSDAYRSSVNDLGTQAATTLAKPQTYNPATLAAPAPYKPIDPANVAGGTGTQKGALESIGDWLAPGLSTAELIARLGRR